MTSEWVKSNHFSVNGDSNYNEYMDLLTDTGFELQHKRIHLLKRHKKNPCFSFAEHNMNVFNSCSGRKTNDIDRVFQLPSYGSFIFPFSFAFTLLLHCQLVTGGQN